MSAPIPPRLSDLFRPPPGFTPPVGAAQAAAVAEAHPTLPQFWASCPRADWMLWVVGWHRLPMKPVARACARTLRCGLEVESLAEDAAKELARVEAWSLSDAPSRSIAWNDQLTEVEPLLPSEHPARAAIASLVDVAKYGTNLGPALPSVLSNVAVWAARSVVPLGPWSRDPAALERLQAMADELRVDATWLDAAVPPSHVPPSWAEARKSWSSLFE